MRSRTVPSVTKTPNPGELRDFPLIALVGLTPIDRHRDQEGSHIFVRKEQQRQWSQTPYNQRIRT